MKGSSLAGSLAWLLSGGGSLKERVLRGGIWLLMGDGAAQAASFVKIAILGRLLSPNDFGLLGIAMVALHWLEYLTTTGFNAALIQRSGDIRPYLDTAWTVQLIRSLGLALVLFTGAPLGAWFFGNPDATSIIRAVGFITLFRGLTNPAVVYLRKELELRREVMWRMSGVVAGLVVAVSIAFAYRNVWALVLSLIAAQAVESLLSYWIEPYRPKLRLNWDKARELVQFGKWIFWSNIVAFLNLNTASLAVGKLLGATALAFYQMAHHIALFPASHVAALVTGVMFPAFSKLKEERNFRAAFIQTLGLVCSVTIPAGCFLTLFAEPVVLIVLGPQWVSISPAIQILAVAEVASGFNGITTPLFAAMGKPDLPVWASVVRILVMAGLFYPLATNFGINGMALASTISAVASMALNVWLVTRLLRLTGLEMISALKLGAVGSAPFLGAALLVSPSLSPSAFVTVGLALLAYIGILVNGMRLHFGVRLGFW